MPAGGAPDPPADDNDEWAALIRANTAQDSVDAGGGRISFSVAQVHCESLFGGAWFYAPRRWETADGCVPGRVVWAYWDATHLVRARTALDTAQGINVAMAGEGETVRDKTFERAFPQE